MFMKTGRKNHPPVLFSPVRKTRFAPMSMILTTLAVPLALSGMLPIPAAALPAVQVKPAAAAAIVAPMPIAPSTAILPGVEAQLVKYQQAPTRAPQAAPTTADRNAIIDRMSKALTDVKTAQGKFSQVDAAGKTQSGNFYISRPGKMRFEYTSPEPVFIISDGATVSIDEPRRKSCDGMPLSQTQFSLFLRTNVDLKRDGSVEAVTSSGGSHFVTLIDTKGEAQGKMILEFRASDFELLGWRALDGAGAETRVRLTDVTRNVTLKPSLFVVKSCFDERR
jgi:outer membrane lipoprotein-sorting protein